MQESSSKKPIISAANIAEIPTNSYQLFEYEGIFFVVGSVFNVLVAMHR